MTADKDQSSELPIMGDETETRDTLGTSVIRRSRVPPRAWGGAFSPRLDNII